MDRNELQERFKSGERNFSGVDLMSEDLTRINLSGADLSNAKMEGGLYRTS